MKYKEKPIIVEAVQWLGANIKEVISAFGSQEIIYGDEGRLTLQVHSNEKMMVVNIGDWITRDQMNELRCFTPAIFMARYEPAPESNTP